MKIYIVTDGSYSDYAIERVFSNRPAAEEYRKWQNIYNEVEEFDVHDEPFTKEDGEKAMEIRVQGKIYPEAVVDIKYEIRPRMIYSDSITRGAGLFYQNHNRLSIYKYGCIPADKWDEERYKAKFTKSLYDLAAVAKDMLADGATLSMVDMAINNKDEVDVSYENDF